jgi:hypothetical protein
MDFIKINWHSSINFGDELNPYLIKKLWNIDPVKVNEGDESPHLMMLGSILNEANKGTIIMGAGLVASDRTFTGNPKFIGLRGKLTKAILKERGFKVDNVFLGDPSVLLPEFYNPHIEKKYDLGIIPHLVDYENALNIFNDTERFLVIDLRIDENNTIEKIIDKIKSCKCTISSSLHGFIVSHAYGIPGTWCKFSDNVIGDGFKFIDYLSAYTDLYNEVPFFDLRNLEKEEINIDKIIELSSITIINNQIELERIKAGLELGKLRINQMKKRKNYHRVVN